MRCARRKLIETTDVWLTGDAKRANMGGNLFNRNLASAQQVNANATSGWTPGAGMGCIRR